MLHLFQRVHTPRPHTSADLHLARAAELHVFQLMRDKVGWGEKEGHLALVVLQSQLSLLSSSGKDPATDLGSNEQVPTLDEVPTEIPRRLTNELYTYVVPVRSAQITLSLAILPRSDPYSLKSVPS